MMKKRLGRAVSLLLCLSMLLGMVAPAAAAAAEDQAAPQAEVSDYEIYPTPQKVTYGTGTVTLPAAMQVTYGAGIDSYTKARAEEAFGVAGVTLSESASTTVKLSVTIGDTGNNGKYDAYKLTIDASGVTVVGKDTDAAFYGLTTVKRILQQVEDRQVRHLTVEDYADVPFRGFIEGYYGNPWTTDDRVSLMKFGGEYKMNIYFYAPKDDPKHNAQWRVEYTADELENKIRPLAEAGNESKCYFGFALHPFMNNPIRFDSDEHYDADLAVLKAKYEQAMSVGVRQIAVLGDDAGAPAGGGASYVRLLTDLTNWLKSDEMQKKYPGLKTSIPFCPDDYMGNGSSAQIQALKDLPDSVPVIQTGGQIWGHVEHSFLAAYKNNTGKGPFLWVNWPCSDNSKTSLTMGGHGDVLHSDLTAEDIATLQGIMINPMQQSEPSKAGIFQLADYSWNVWNGSDSAKRIADVWDDTFKYVDHDSAIETDASIALRELSKHMIHQNGRTNGSYGKYDESIELAPKLTAFREKLAAGTLTAEDVAAMRSEFETLNNAAKLYSNEENVGNKRLLGKRDGDGYLNSQEQMAPWLDCWVEFSQANLDLLDALALILDNSTGKNDSRIVSYYLSGQSNLTASQGHKFWYIDHYETAKVGGLYIVPFTNELLSVVAEEAQTIINPSVLTETIITNRADTPDGGLDAMRDGSMTTEAIFKSGSKIDVGDYVGVRYNQAISVNSVRFEVGRSGNADDSFNGAKLQYMDENGEWQDIPGGAFPNRVSTMEVTGLSLTTKGIRAIATAAVTGKWFAIKEIYINGQSGVGGESEVATGQLTGTVIKPSNWTVYQASQNPESNLTDNDDDTIVWYQETGDNKDTSIVGDYIGLDLGRVVKNVGRVRFVVGKGGGNTDKWTNFKLQYSTDNTNWTDVNTYASSNSQDVFEEELGGVEARYIRFVNTVQVSKWLYFAELSVWADDSSAIVYRSQKLGRLAKPVGALTDNSASLAADLVTLRPGEFVGIALPRIRALTEIKASYTDAPNVVLEVGASEDSMTTVTVDKTTHTVDYTGNARYIRLRNSSPTQTVSFRLDELSVKSDEITGIRYDEDKSNMGLDANYGYQDNRGNLAFFDGDIGTSTVLAHSQDAGLYVTYDLGQLRPIKKLAMAMSESEKNYLRHGVLEVSPTGADDSWTTVVTVDNDGVAESEVKDGAASDLSFKRGVPQMNYVSFVGELDQAVSARYLRIRVTKAGSKFISAVEILINTESLNEMEYLPTVNDPTFVADPIEQAGYAPANMRDGDLTTAFRPNMTGKESGSVIYRLSDETSIGQINVLADAATSTGVEVFIREVGGVSFERLGALTSGLTQVPVPESFTNVAEIKLSWGNQTPTIYELITVARDKAAGGTGQTSSDSETVPINSYGGDERSILFDENWKFNLGDASGASAKVYNDSAWRTVNLPHDYAIEQSFTSAGEAESGYLIGGVGWYRKSFTVAPEWKNKTVTIDFGGVYMDAEVYLNGVKLGEHHYGYSPFSFVLPSDLLVDNGENVIAVKTDDSFPSSRWYSGAGIYRSVHLTVTDPVHVAKYGAKVVTTNTGSVTVTTTVQNDGGSTANVTVEQAIYELDGTTFERKETAVATTAAGEPASPAAKGTAEVTQTLSVSGPKLWNTWDKCEDGSKPNLYVLVTTIKQDGAVVDTYETEFGFRTIDFSSNEGFKLNGENLKLKGVCQHHDQGALGAEAWYRALERQVDILMGMGCNAIRVTHNPAADELIEICNRKGVLIIDELFDGWHRSKNGNSGDFGKWFSKTIDADNALVGKQTGDTWAKFVTQTVVNRDKNAPCVIMYSLGNEITEGAGYDANYATNAAKLIEWAQAIDRTRPLTYGQNNRNSDELKTAVAEKIHAAGGVIGINYYGSYDFAEAHNDWGWRVYASETVSHVNSRGVYNVKGNQEFNSDKLLTSYDKSCVGWGAVASDGWWRTIRLDYDMGEFIWTGFDYIGEPTPSNGTGSGWAAGEDSPKNSFFGAVDTNGLPKDNYWLYRSMWNESDTTLHLLPTWDRDDILIDSNGNVEVVVYSNAHTVKLYLNNKEVGAATSTTHTTDAGHVYRTFDNGTGAFVKRDADTHQTLYATFNVKYEKGTLEVRAFDAQDNQITTTHGRSAVSSTSGASALRATADRTTIRNDGRDLSYVTIDVVDQMGEIVNGAKNPITVTVTGDGVFMGLDNGVQSDHTSYLSNTRKPGAGQVVAIIQSTKKEGSFTVTATAAGLTPASTTVKTGGAASAAGDATPVSYIIAKTVYVQRGVEPTLPETATVILSDGTRDADQHVTWNGYNKSLLNTVGSEFAITGVIDGGGYNIPVSVGVVVLDEVAALLNYSTVIRVGSTPRLPESRPAVMADGTVLTAQFPVTWEKTSANAFVRQGTVEIHGEAEVFGTKMDVTAWVRVAEGGVIEGDSVSSAAVRHSVKGTSEPDESFVRDATLEKAYDGKADTSWTGSGTTKVYFDTAQNLYRIVLTYDSAPPATGVTLTLERGTVNVKPTISGNTATYELGGINSSISVEIDFADSVTLVDVELITATPTFETYGAAELDGLKFNGESASAAQLASRTVKTSLLMPAIVPVSSRNVAYTILPEEDGTVIIVTESEDQSRRDLYTVQLGVEDYADGSQDYPREKTTPLAESQAGVNTSNGEGGAGHVTDDNPGTFWHTRWGDGGSGTSNPTDVSKRYIELKLDEETSVIALRYLPRSNVGNGTVTSYRVAVSTDGTNYTTVAEGNWTRNTDEGQVWKIAKFDAVQAKYVRLYGVHTYGDSGNDKFMSCAELRVVVAAKEDMSPATVTVDPPTQHWRNVVLEAKNVIVTLFGTALIEGTDYELVYENNRDVGTAYVYAVAKSDGKYQGSAYGTFKIEMEKVDAEDLETRTVWIQEGVEPQLPETIRVAMSDGHFQEWEVKWADIPESKYTNIDISDPENKTFDVLGEVVGAPEGVKATLHVNVALAVSADSVSAMTVPGVAPALPSKVTVHFDDGTSRECGVAWNLEGKSWGLGTETVTGTVTGISRLPATANVRVAAGSEEKLLSQSDPADTNVNQFTNTSIFPFAMAWHSSGNNNPYVLIDGTVSSSWNAGWAASGEGAYPDRWSDWQSGTAHDTIWAGVAFKTSTTLTERKEAQTLTLENKVVKSVTVRFIDENASIIASSGVTYPKTYDIQYYTGPTKDLVFDTRLTSGDTMTGGNGRVRGWTGSPLLDDNNWKTVTYTSKPDIVLNSTQDLTVEFDPVTTSIIRVKTTHRDGTKWVGMTKLEVYGMDLPEAKKTITVDSITLGGVALNKTDDFRADENDSTVFVMDKPLGANEPIPQLVVTLDSTAGDNASVSTVQATRAPGKNEAGSAWAVATITAEDGKTTETYIVKFTRTGMENMKYKIDVEVKSGITPGADAQYVSLSVDGNTLAEEVLGENGEGILAGKTVTINVSRPGYRLSAPWVVVETCYCGGDDHKGQIIDVEDNSFVMPTGDVKLTTSIALDSYEITYNLDGGVVSRANPTSYTYESSSFTLNNPTKAGYTFAGWTGTGISGKAETVTITTNSEGSREYTATWTPVTYPINYALDGGTNHPTNLETYTATTPTFTLSPPTKDGYTFVGWTGTDITGVVETVTVAKGSSGTRNYVAVWSAGQEDKDALAAAIAAAGEAKTGLVTEPNGTEPEDVQEGVEYVTQEVMDRLNAAIAAAQEVADNPKATEAEVKAATTTLNDAVELFKNNIRTGGESEEPTPPGETVDKDALNDAIAAAEAAKTGIEVVSNGTTEADVDKGVKFVTWDTLSALNAAIARAKGVVESRAVTQEQVDAAKAELEQAVDAFNAAIRTGSKETGTSQTGPGSGTVAPVDPAPNKPDDSDTTTKVEQNDDGSTTTTVTDNKTGVVTATTEKKDGSTVVKVTDANEDVTITVTSADGEELAKVAIPAVIPEPEHRFDDVPEGHWADEAIHNMAALDIVRGVGGNTYNRNGDMKRGDLALVLSRISGKEENGFTQTFGDVPATKYYAGGVAWAAKAGVVTGRSADTFAPEDTITREELAVMLCRYAVLVGIDTSASRAELDAFTDGTSTHSWAADGIAWCVKAGILQGRNNGALDPRTNVTRAEVAVMLQRFMNLMK